jgi:hypothetical protein
MENLVVLSIAGFCFLILFRIAKFTINWILVIIEDFTHQFLPKEKHYTLKFFKKADNILNKFRWND